MRLLLILALIISMLLAACSEPPTPSETPNHDVTAGKSSGLGTIERLVPLHKKLGPIRPGDWLSSHEEHGQTFAEYKHCDPSLPQGKRHKIYVLPIGSFEAAQQGILDDTVEFMAIFFGLPVEVQAPMPLAEIPKTARRKHPEWGMEQLFTPYILDDLLLTALPADAAAYIALTTVDLWPGRGWNFVFGQASIEERVGVWSVARNGDPNPSEAAYRLSLLRCLKTACHETGHMFSIQHCIAYECLMCGSNSRRESDRQPLWTCPECLAKVLWATPAKAHDRFVKLEAFCEKRGLQDQARFYRRSLEALGPTRSK